ncbi:MAG: YbaB/EbfC family nucleoid-associated protein [Bacilli bacterium]|nr:YbaB/EbfC family nucleoid-associated protein [Bacilli bacterium]
MNMQQMLIQAQKMKRELEKALNELKAQEFSITKNGMVTIKMLGDKTVTSIDIDEDAFDKENKDMVQESIVLGINELSKQISDMEDEINERVTGQKGGFPF